MNEANTIEQILRRGDDKAPAIGAPEHETMNFATLRGLVAATVTRLNALGIGRNDRVAIVVPNGPRAATGFLA
ncbi:MAG TPA: AMP-dependent synthetase, partial [Stellaceae bacterium]